MRKNGNGKRNGNGKKGQGKANKITDKLIDKVCELIAAGNFIETAALAVGIHYGTFYNWIKWGDPRHAEYKKDSDYECFFKAVKHAEAHAEIEMLQGMFEAQGKNWVRFAWWLERRQPGRWGRRFQQLPQSQDDGVQGIQQAQDAFQDALASPEGAKVAESASNILRMNGHPRKKAS